MILLKKANNPLLAVGFLLKGAKLLTDPKLRGFVLIPILINVVLYSVALALGYYYLEQFVNQSIPVWLHWLNWILLPLFFISFFIAGFFSFTVLANLIAAPFYGLLAAKTQAMLSHEIDFVEQPLGQVLRAEAKRMLYIVTRMLPLLVLFVIPVINIIASFVWAIFGAWCLAMEYMAYPLENEGVLFAEQKDLLKSARLGTLSFGAVTMLGLTLPLINIIVGPAAVIGATLYLYEMREKPQDTDAPTHEIVQA